MYIDGVLNSTGTVTNLNHNLNNIVIGRLYNSISNSTYFDGKLDDLRIYKSLLSDNDISTQFTTGINKLQETSFTPIVYPNIIASNQIIYIQNENKQPNCTIQLFNSFGQLILSEKNITELVIPEIPDGIYFLSINYIESDIRHTGISKILIRN